MKQKKCNRKFPNGEEKMEDDNGVEEDEEYIDFKDLKKEENIVMACGDCSTYKSLGPSDGSCSDIYRKNISSSGTFVTDKNFKESVKFQNNRQVDRNETTTQKENC